MASATQLSYDMEYDVESLCSTTLQSRNGVSIEQDPCNVSITSPPHTIINVDTLASAQSSLSPLYLSHLSNQSLDLPRQLRKISRHKWEYAINNFVPTMKSLCSGHLQMLVEREHPWSYYLCKGSDGYYKKIYYKKILMNKYNVEKTFSYYSDSHNKQEHVIELKITKRITKKN
jgi:hypothetical protein